MNGCNTHILRADSGQEQGLKREHDHPFESYPSGQSRTVNANILQSTRMGAEGASAAFTASDIKCVPVRENKTEKEPPNLSLHIGGLLPKTKRPHQILHSKTTWQRCPILLLYKTPILKRKKKNSHHQTDGKCIFGKILCHSNVMISLQIESLNFKLHLVLAKYSFLVQDI